MSAVLVTVVFAAVAILLAAYFTFPCRNKPFDLKVVLDGLLRAESSAVLSPDVKIAVGFGSCLDVVGNGLHVMETIGGLVPDVPENFNEIDGPDELQKTFAYFFMHGASAGRLTKNNSLFDEVMKIMKDLPDTRFMLGGNAPAMTKRFGKEAVKVLLAASVPDNHLKEFSTGISVVRGLAPGSDVHLVLEYKRQAVWGKYIATRANRFILYNQNENNFTSLLNEFSAQQDSFKPHVLVVGGLRMMLNFKQSNGRTALDELNLLLAKLSASTKIHLEMSSFSEATQLQSIVDNAVFYADSLGMNEQELPNLLSFLRTKRMVPVSDSHPRIAVTLDYMRGVFGILGATPEENGRRRMSRLHVHTLAYQVIMTARNSTWKNSAAAAAKSALTANRHTCGSDAIDVGTATLLTDESFAHGARPDDGRTWFDPENPVSCWVEDGIDICVAPVLVCTRVVQTVGGGDNVSAAGLVLQI